jgi:putative protease
MAAAKKRKAKVKRKKVLAKKPAIRRKSKALKKKSPARKKPARRAGTRKPAARPSPKPRPAPPAAPAPERVAAPGETRVGVVTHYFGHLSVAAVRLERMLRVGDTVRILGHTSDFRQRVDSMQVEHQAVSEAMGGQEIGLRVIEHAREHDVVYKVSMP